MNNKIFKDYFGYCNPSTLLKDLFIANQAKNEQIVNQVKNLAWLFDYK